MIISYKHKYVFIHIPKTGGTSISHVLSKSLDTNSDIMLMHWMSSEELKNNQKTAIKHDMPFSGHLAARHIDRKLKDSKKYFKFAFVRNPWDRLVSLYFYLLSTCNNNMTCSFTEWIMNDISRIGNIPLSCMLIHKKQPQIERLTNNNVLLVDFIGRFENIHEDFDKITNNIGVYNTGLPHKNKTHHDHYAKYYNNKTINKVRQWYKEDIDYFGYKFESVI